MPRKIKEEKEIIKSFKTRWKQTATTAEEKADKALDLNEILHNEIAHLRDAIADLQRRR